MHAAWRNHTPRVVSIWQRNLEEHKARNKASYLAQLRSHFVHIFNMLYPVTDRVSLSDDKLAG